MAAPVRLLGALGLALAAGALATGGPSCGTDAVGVDACRRIEAKRCEVAPTCSADYKDVDACNDYFRDQCLHGIENADRSPSDSDVKGCVDAIAKAAECAKSGAKTLVECAGHPDLVQSAPPTLTPCEAITKSPDLMAACAFLAKPVVDAGVLTDAPSEASDGAGGGGGASSSSSSSSASSSSSSSSAASSSSAGGAGGGGGAGGA